MGELPLLPRLLGRRLPTSAKTQIVDLALVGLRLGFNRNEVATWVAGFGLVDRRQAARYVGQAGAMLTARLRREIRGELGEETVEKLTAQIVVALERADARRNGKTP